MRRAGETRIESHVRRVLRLGLYAVLLASPLPFASVEPGAVLLIELGAAGLGLGALWLLYREPGQLPRRARVALLCLGTVLAVGVLQLMPIPEGWVSVLAGPAHDWRGAVGAHLPEAESPLRPLSLSPPDTLDALLRLTAWGCIGLTAALALTRRHHLRVAMGVVLASATFQALYGAAEKISGHHHIFAYAKRYDLDAATGTFINANHFAGYLAVALPLGLGLLLRHAGSLSLGSTWRDRFVAILQPHGQRVLAGGLIAAILWGGILLSYSRGALAAALLGAGLLLWGTSMSRYRTVVLAAVVVVPVLVLSHLQVRAPGEDFAAPRTELLSIGFRVPIWKEALELAPSYSALGAGLGSFEAAFYPYRPEGLDVRVDHAHNDWLEALLEGGVLVLAAMVVLVGVVLIPRRARDAPGTPSIHDASLRAAVAVAAFHALIDFPLRIPAIAVLVASLVGMALSRAAASDGSGAPPERPRPVAV